MNPIRKTISFCPKCYKAIEADIYIENEQVIMSKVCSEHGMFQSVVESSATYWLQCQEAAAPTIYGGHFIDVTERCNLRCKYCYYPVNNRQKERSMASIVQEAIMNRQAERFILTGGEPMLRDDIFEIIENLQKIRPVELLTNGTMINEKNICRIVELLSEPMGIRLNLSIHQENDGIHDLMTLLRKKRIRIESILWVIDHLDDIDEIMDFCSNWSDVICATRIKAATPIWNEQKPKKRIYVSDMLQKMIGLGAVPVWWRNNKTSFFNVAIGGIIHMLVSWYDVSNIDIYDINCAPTYTAKTGHVLNIVTSMIINEGISKGWMNGVNLWGSQAH